MTVSKEIETQRAAIRILLVDDHALFRESVSRMLESESDMAVDHCGTIQEALALLSQRQFDLVLSTTTWARSALPSSCRPPGRRASRAGCWW